MLSYRGAVAINYYYYYYHVTMSFIYFKKICSCIHILTGSCDNRIVWAVKKNKNMKDHRDTDIDVFLCGFRSPGVPPPPPRI